MINNSSLKVEIEVDGGIGIENIERVLKTQEQIYLLLGLLYLIQLVIMKLSKK